MCGICMLECGTWIVHINGAHMLHEGHVCSVCCVRHVVYVVCTVSVYVCIWDVW